MNSSVYVDVSFQSLQTILFLSILARIASLEKINCRVNPNFREAGAHVTVSSVIILRLLDIVGELLVGGLSVGELLVGILLAGGMHFGGLSVGELLVGGLSALFWRFQNYDKRFNFHINSDTFGAQKEAFLLWES